MDKETESLEDRGFVVVEIPENRVQFQVNNITKKIDSILNGQNPTLNTLTSKQDTGFQTAWVNSIIGMSLDVESTQNWNEIAGSTDLQTQPINDFYSNLGVAVILNNTSIFQAQLEQISPQALIVCEYGTQTQMPVSSENQTVGDVSTDIQKLDNFLKFCDKLALLENQLVMINGGYGGASIENLHAQSFYFGDCNSGLLDFAEDERFDLSQLPGIFNHLNSCRIPFNIRFLGGAKFGIVVHRWQNDLTTSGFTNESIFQPVPNINQDSEVDWQYVLYKILSPAGIEMFCDGLWLGHEVIFKQVCENLIVTHSGFNTKFQEIIQKFQTPENENVHFLRDYCHQIRHKLRTTELDI